MAISTDASLLSINKSFYIKYLELLTNDNDISFSGI